MHASLSDRIDDLLPQTQCTRCGYGGCKPYAEAVAVGAADIDQCPPGGDATIAALAGLLGVARKPLNPAYGVEQAPTVAVIDEARCIGCFKCVLACPVDAIVGAAKRMHTVIGAECSGCELCIPPCPVDCIVMLPRPAALPEPLAQAPLWRRRHRARKTRQADEQQARAEARRRREPTLREQAQAFDIDAAIARSRAKRGVESIPVTGLPPAPSLEQSPVRPSLAGREAGEASLRSPRLAPGGNDAKE